MRVRPCPPPGGGVPCGFRGTHATPRLCYSGAGSSWGGASRRTRPSAPPPRTSSRTRGSPPYPSTAAVRPGPLSHPYAKHSMPPRHALRLPVSPLRIAVKLLPPCVPTSPPPWRGSLQPPQISAPPLWALGGTSFPTHGGWALNRTVGPIDVLLCFIIVQWALYLDPGLVAPGPGLYLGMGFRWGVIPTPCPWVGLPRPTRPPRHPHRHPGVLRRGPRRGQWQDWSPRPEGPAPQPPPAPRRPR